MAINKHFQNDIFVSYARADDQQGLVKDIIEKLEKIINKLKTKDEPQVKIWWDQREMKNHFFDEEIRSQIKQSATFLILKSSNYLKSEYCNISERPCIERTELKHQSILPIGNLSREIILQISELGVGQKDIDRADTNQFKLSVDGTRNYPDSPDSNYQVSIEHIANIHLSTLRKIAEVDNLDFSKITLIKLFIASTSKHMNKAKMELIQDLEQYQAMDDCLDIEIEYGVPPPMSYRRHQRRLQKCKECDIIIHLFGTSPGLELEDIETPTFADQEQYKFFNKTNLIPKLRIIWMEEEAFRISSRESENDHFRFLDHLIRNFGHLAEKSDDGSGELEVIKNKGPLGNVTRFICSQTTDVAYSLGPLVEQVIRENLTREPESQTVCIDFHPEAARYGAILNTNLEATERVEVKLYMVDENKEAKENEQQFKKQLGQSSKYVVHLHDVKRLNWAKRKLEAAFKIIRGEKSNKEIILYINSPIDVTPIQEALEMYEVILIKNEEDLFGKLGAFN